MLKREVLAPRYLPRRGHLVAALGLALGLIGAGLNVAAQFTQHDHEMREALRYQLDKLEQHIEQRDHDAERYIRRWRSRP